MARQSCKDHATCCDRHFSSLKAFDLHRPGSVCTDPAAITKLAIWTEEGSCKLMKGCYVNGKLVHYEEPVIIWSIAISPEELERLAKLKENRVTART